MPDTDLFGQPIAQPAKALQLPLFHEPVQIDPPHTRDPIDKRLARKSDPAAPPSRFKRPKRMSAAQAVRRVPGQGKLYGTVDADLTRRGIPFVRVSEAAKSLKKMGRLKHFDFVVYRATGDNWLVLCKGRNSGADMKRWEEIFGEGFKAIVASRVSPDAKTAKAGETIAYHDLNGLPIDLPA